MTNIDFGIISSTIAAIIFALQAVILFKGVKSANIYPGVLISLALGIPTFILLGIATGELSQIGQIKSEMMILILLTGIVHFIIGRTLIYNSTKLIGSNRVVPISSTSILTSVWLSTILLDEHITGIITIAIILIFFGIIILSLSQVKNKRIEKNAFKKGMILALLTVCTFTASTLLVRVTTSTTGLPVVNLLIAYIAAIILYSIPLSTKKYRNTFRTLQKPELFCFILAGILINIAHTFRYIALEITEITVAQPILGTSPLFVVIFSYLINRKIEYFNRKLILGMVTILIGINIYYLI